MKTATETGCARAFSKNLAISTKHCVEISHQLRYKTTAVAKTYLTQVMAKKQAVPFRRFTADIGHKKGMSSGRYPQKAAEAFLKLLKSVEANALDRGLNVEALKITKLVSNKAAIPLTGGRRRHATKRSHLEVEVRELFQSKKPVKRKEAKKASSKDPKEVPPKASSEVKKTPVNDSVKEDAVSVPAASTKKEVVASQVDKVKDTLQKAESTDAAVKKDEKVPAKEPVAKKPAVAFPPVKADDSLKEGVGAAVPFKSEGSAPVLATKVPVARKLDIASNAPVVKDLSPQELLKRAQQIAAMHNQKVKEQQKTDEVADLLQKLQTKGTLRK